MTHRLVRLLAAVLLAAPLAGFAGQAFRPFTADSPDALRKAHAGRPFVLALWSVNCEPCHEELALLGQAAQRHPRLAVVLVNVDGAEERERAAALLVRHRLSRVASWQYADEAEERLRYAIDPAWRGELPRSYFFDAAHRPQARSGRVDAAWLEGWIAAQASAPAAGARR